VRVVSSPTAPLTAVSGAATAWVHNRLAGPVRRAPVVHAGRDAVYVDDAGSCLGVLARPAVAVPCGVRTLVELIDPVGGGALVGDGRILLGGLEVTVARILDASVAAVDTVPPVDVTTDELPDEALALLADGDPAAVGLLLGRGSGLTPLGDDVLCGWLATRVALGRPIEAVVAEVLRIAPVRTTLLSATLLECAARGEVIPEFRDVLSARTGLDPLLAVGHTSGLGLALGMGLARPQMGSQNRGSGIQAHRGTGDHGLNQPSSDQPGRRLSPARSARPAWAGAVK
jgi:hypothetical protein